MIEAIFILKIDFIFKINRIMIIIIMTKVQIMKNMKVKAKKEFLFKNQLK